MAQSAHSILIHKARCMWLAFLNIARSTGNMGTESELKAVEKSLAEKGWVKDANGIVEIDECGKGRKWIIDGKEVLLSTLVEKEMADRKERHEALQKAAKFDNKDLLKLAVWEEIYMKGGKLIPVDFIGVSGNRRDFVYLNAMVERSKLTEEVMVKDEKTGKESLVKRKLPPADHMIPVIVDDYSDELNRLEKQAQENRLKTTGFLQGSPVDEFLAAGKMLQCGSSQSRLRDTYGATNGVKYFWTHALATRYKGLRIRERIVLKSDERGYIPIASIKHAKLQSMGQRYTEADTAAYNASKTMKGKPPMAVLTEEEVGKYFDNPSADDEPKDPKMLEKGGVTTLATQHANKIVQMTATRILKNTNGTELKPAEHLANVCDDLLILEAQADHIGAEKIIAALVKLPKGKARDTAEKAIFKILGIEG